MVDDEFVARCFLRLHFDPVSFWFSVFAIGHASRPQSFSAWPTPRSGSRIAAISDPNVGDVGKPKEPQISPGPIRAAVDQVFCFSWMSCDDAATPFLPGLGYCPCFWFLGLFVFWTEF